MVKKAITKHANKVRTNRSLSILAIVAVFLTSVSFVLSRGLLGDIGFNSKLQSRKSEVNNKLEQSVSALPKLQENFKFLSENGPRPSEILDALPASVDYDGFGRDLETMAALAGVQLNSVNTLAQTSSDGSANSLQSTTFQTSVSGTYDGLLRFMKNLEIFARPVVVNLMTFSGTEPSVSLDLSLTTFWQPISQVSDETEEFNEN